MTGEPFLNARQAAKYVGFEPGEGTARDDKEMRRFYEWVRVARVPKHQRGPRNLLFRVSELEAAIAAASADDPVATTESLDRMETLARDWIRGGLRIAKAR